MRTGIVRPRSNFTESSCDRHRLVGIGCEPPSWAATTRNRPLTDRSTASAGQRRSHRMHRFRHAVIAAGILTLSIAGVTQAGGPPGIGFYVDGDPYRTVG